MVLTLRRIGAFLILVLYLLLAGMHAYCWMKARPHSPSRHYLRCAPILERFFGIRVLCSTLSTSCVPLSFAGTAPAEPSTFPLANLGMLTGLTNDTMQWTIHGLGHTYTTSYTYTLCIHVMIYSVHWL